MLLTHCTVHIWDYPANNNHNVQLGIAKECCVAKLFCEMRIFLGTVQHLIDFKIVVIFMQGIAFTLLYNQWPLFPDTVLLFLHQLLVSKNMLLLGDEWPGCSSYQGSWWFLLAMEPLLERPRSLSWNPWQTVGCWCQAGPVELPREVLTKFAQISSFQGSDWSTVEWDDGSLTMWHYDGSLNN